MNPIATRPMVNSNKSSQSNKSHHNTTNEPVALTRITYNSKNPNNLSHAFTAPKTKLPLQITQDNNRLIINLVDQEDEPEERKSLNVGLTASTLDLASSKVVAEVMAARQSRLKRMKSSFRSGPKPSTKPPKVKNENLINILRENCEKQKVLPCDAFITPLMALSNYYKTDKEKPAKKKDSTQSDEFTMLIEKAIASSSELVKFQKKQSEKIKYINSGHQGKKERPKRILIDEDSPKNLNLKEIVAEAGDLSHLFLPLIHLGELDRSGKKTSRLIKTFRQGVEFYRKKVGSRSSSVSNVSAKSKRTPSPKPIHRAQSLPAGTSERHEPMDKEKAARDYSPFEAIDGSKRSTQPSIISTSPTTVESNYTNEVSQKSGNEDQSKKSSLGPQSLRGITNSIGDLIKILQSSSSSNSATHSSDNNHQQDTHQSHLKLHALNAEIDRTMSEISKFRSEVSNRISRHQGLTDYEKDILNLLNPKEFSDTEKTISKPLIDKKFAETGVNTDISMFNAIFTVQFLDKPSNLIMLTVEERVSHNAKKQKETRTRKSRAQNSVKINEVSVNDSSFMEMPRKTEDEFDVPIIETPETSKNESSSVERHLKVRNVGPGPMLSHIKKDFQPNTNTNSLITNSTSYSEILIPIQRSGRPNSAQPRYNLNMLRPNNNNHIYPDAFDPTCMHHHHHHQHHQTYLQQRVSGPVNLNYRQFNTAQIINRDRDNRDDTENIDDDFDNEMELFSNESSLSEEVTLNNGFFKKIFTRSDYKRMNEEDDSFSGTPVRPISLVHIKKPSNQNYENQPLPQQRSSSSSSNSESPKSVKNSLFQPVRGTKIPKIQINQRSHSSQHQQPLTRMPVFDFSDQNATPVKQQQRVELKQMALNGTGGAQIRSNTFDSINSVNYYDNFTVRCSSNPHNCQDKLSDNDFVQPNYTDFTGQQDTNKSHQSRANHRSSLRHDSPNKYSGSSTNDELPIEDPVLYQISSTHTTPPVTLDYLYTNNNNNHPNNKSARQLNQYRESPLNDRTNRYIDRALVLHTSDDNIGDDELILKINDFKRPHSAFQIDNPPDENHHNQNGVEFNSIHLMKQGDRDMNRSSSSASKKNSNHYINSETMDQNCINKFATRRHCSVFKNQKFVNYPAEYLNQKTGNDQLTTENDGNKAGKQKFRSSNIKLEQPQKYVIHYPISNSSSNSTINEVSAASREQQRTKPNGLKKPIESVMLNAYKLPITQLKSAKFKN